MNPWVIVIVLYNCDLEQFYQKWERDAENQNVYFYTTNPYRAMKFASRDEAQLAAAGFKNLIPMRISITREYASAANFATVTAKDAIPASI